MEAINYLLLTYFFLASHGNLLGSGAIPQRTRQMQQQASKNAAAVMTQSVGAPEPVMQTSSMDYTSSYRSSAQQMQLNAAINPLLPMTAIPPSMIPQQQMPNVNQDITSKTIDRTAVSLSIKTLGRIPKKGRDNKVITQTFG